MAIYIPKIKREYQRCTQCVMDTTDSMIEFDEQGTVAQTIQIHAGGAGAAAPYNGDGLHVVLNQPFVYVIHDPNGLPLYIGSVMDL